MILSGLFWLAAFASLDCQAISSDRIVAADLARVLPEFAGLPGELVLGYSPLPGLKRIFRPDELVRIARTHQIETKVSRGVCFSWRMQPLHPDEVRQVMQTAMDEPAAGLEIVGLTPRITPPGRLVFPRNTLVTANPARPSDPVLWRGYIQYSETRRYPVAARVRLTLSTTRVVAVVPLKAGQPIRPDMIREETYLAPTLGALVARSASEVIGRTPRRTVALGSPVLKAELVAPLEVTRGDRIDVEVRTGAAHLRLEARAESGGRTGDMIQVRNLSSNKLFMARISGAGRAQVGPQGNSQQ